MVSPSHSHCSPQYHAHGRAIMANRRAGIAPLLSAASVRRRAGAEAKEPRNRVLDNTDCCWFRQAIWTRQGGVTVSASNWPFEAQRVVLSLTSSTLALRRPCPRCPQSQSAGGPDAHARLPALACSRPRPAQPPVEQPKYPSRHDDIGTERCNRCYCCTACLVRP